MTLSTKLFTTRLDLIAELDRSDVPASQGEEAGELRSETASLLHGVVASMNLDNFVVRPKREHVERFAKAEAWTVLGRRTSTSSPRRSRRFRRTSRQKRRRPSALTF